MQSQQNKLQTNTNNNNTRGEKKKKQKKQKKSILYYYYNTDLSSDDEVYTRLKDYLNSVNTNKIVSNSNNTSNNKK